MISMAFSSIGFAQTTPTFGVRAGVASSGIRGEAIENLDKLLDFTNGMVTKTNYTGFFVGLNSSIPLGENFSVEPGIYYTQKGSQINGKLNGKIGDLIGVSAKSVLQANYIDVPLILKANLGGLELIRRSANFLSHRCSFKNFRRRSWNKSFEQYDGCFLCA